MMFIGTSSAVTRPPAIAPATSSARMTSSTSTVLVVLVVLLVLLVPDALLGTSSTSITRRATGSTRTADEDTQNALLLSC